MTQRLSDGVHPQNAEPIAASLRKYGYRGPRGAHDVARWLGAQRPDINTALAAPKRTERERRPKQAAFRNALLIAYEGRCAISGCDAAPALEAAHVADWHAENDVGAGILLRADLHRLFESGLLVIDGRYEVAEAPAWYGELRGRRLRLPVNRLHWPRLPVVGCDGAAPDGSRS